MCALEFCCFTENKKKKNSFRWRSGRETTITFLSQYSKLMKIMMFFKFFVRRGLKLIFLLTLIFLFFSYRLFSLCTFLGALAKLRKATINIVTSVSLSVSLSVCLYVCMYVCQSWTYRFPLDAFPRNLTFERPREMLGPQREVLWISRRRCLRFLCFISQYYLTYVC